MRVALIVPPSGFQLDERVYPMLGVLKVAASLRAGGHDVTVWDLSDGPRPHGCVKWSPTDRPNELDWLLEHTQDVYGITATMPQMPAAVAIAKQIRESDPYRRAKIILGGAHPTMVNAAAVRGVERSKRMLHDLRDVFDVVVAGDGEKAVFAAIQPDAPWLIDADRPGEGLFLTPTEVADAAWPSRDLIDLQSYHCWVDGVAGTSIIAQLGCPFQCAFCGGRNSPTFRRMRLRPGHDVVAEMCHIVDTYGIKAFMFLDDELNVNKSYLQLLQQMADAQTARGETWRISGLLKSELFTPQMADLMYAAGFRKLLVGFESGDERILLNMRKMATVEDNTRAVATAHNAGLAIKALMSLGHPGESADSIEHTKQWLLDVKPDEFDATVLTIYPGTPYHDEATQWYAGSQWLENQKATHWTYMAKNGDRLHFRDIDQFTDTPYYKGVPGQYESFVWTDHLSARDLVTLRDTLERDVRSALQIPWPVGTAAVNFEHSMGLR